MKAIILDEILIEGFGIIAEERRFSYNTKGINIVTGRNGAGKTTMFSALTWCIFGTPLKDITMANIPTFEDKRNKKTWKGTRVLLTLTVDGKEYQIARHISYTDQTFGVKGGNSLLIYTDDTIVSNTLHKVSSQDYINSLLGVNYTVFIKSIVFGQKMARLIESSNEEKRKLLEELADMEFVDKAKENAKNEQSRIVKEVDLLKYNVKTLESKKGQLENSLEDHKQVLHTYETQKKERLIALRDKLVTNQELLSTSEVALQNLEVIPQPDDKTPYDSDIENRRAILAGTVKSRDVSIEVYRDIKSSITSKKKDIQVIKEDLGKTLRVCQSCGKPLEEGLSDKIKKELEAKHTQLLEELELLEESLELGEATQSTLKNEVDTLTSELDAIVKQKNVFIQNKYRSYDLYVSEKKRFTSECRMYDDAVNSILSSITAEEGKTIENKVQQYTDSILETNSEIIDYNLQLSELNNRLDIVTWWVKDGFSSSGMKSFMFNSLLTLLNNAVKRYSSKLGFIVTFGVDLTKASKPFVTKIQTGEIERDYEVLSGGEQQKVNICLSFAMHDVISTTNNFNLLVLDEVFEGIDTWGATEQIFELIRYKTGTEKSVFIITHNQAVDTQYAKETFIEGEGLFGA